MASLTGIGLVVIAIGVSAFLGTRPSIGSCDANQPVGRFTGFRLIAEDGNCLQCYAWQPSGKPVIATVVVAHGIHDHARGYEGLAQALNESGIALFTWDQRGHAASGGARQRVDAAEQLAGNLAAQAASTDKTIKLYESALHDLLHDSDATRVSQEKSDLFRALPRL